MIINFMRGDNHQVKFKFKTFTGSIDKMYFTVKCERKIVRVAKKLNEGIELVDGYYVITFVPEDTNELMCGIDMIYDIEIIVNGEKYTIAKDKFILEEDVTTPAEEV